MQKSVREEAVQALQRRDERVPNLARQQLVIEIEGQFSGTFYTTEGGKHCFRSESGAPLFKQANDMALLLAVALKEQNEGSVDYAIANEHLESTPTEAELQITLTSLGSPVIPAHRAKTMVRSILNRAASHADMHTSSETVLDEVDEKIAVTAIEKFLSVHGGKSPPRSMRVIMEGEELAVVHGQWVTLEKADIPSEIEMVFVYFDGYKIRSRTAYFQTHGRPSKSIEAYFDEQQHGQFLANLYSERAKTLEVRLRTEWRGGRSRLHIEDIKFAEVGEPLALTSYPDVSEFP